MASGKLRDAVADGPILLRGVRDGHEHVLRPYARAFTKQLRNASEQRFLLFRRAGVEYGDSDEHEIVTPLNSERIAVAEVRSDVLRDGHELIIFWHVER